MISELFIENQRVDISADLSSLLTFAIDDVKDFASRQTTFSKTITIPGTANNNRLFGNIFDTGSSNSYSDTIDNIGYNFNASKSARCLLFQDNLQTFKGTMRMLDIIKDKGNIEYDVALNGELTSLNVALSGALLEDLDFSDYDDTYSDTNIIASWNNVGNGLYYPLIDYGTYSLLKHDWDIKTFRPALFVKEYMDKIFEDAGFRYQSELFETERFRKLIIPHNRKVLTSKNRNVLEALFGSTQLNASVIAWDTIFSSIFILSSGDEHIEYTATPSLSGTLNVTVSGYMSDTDLSIIFYKNGIPIITEIVAYNGFSNPQFWSITASVATFFTTGDYISCIISRLDPGPLDYAITLCTVQFESDIAQDVDIEYLDEVIVNDTLPRNIRQIDFLTSIVKLFNLYVYEDKFDERLIYIKPFVDFYSTDSANAVNWTYKLNRDQSVRIKPMSELNSKIYNFRYKDDSDFYNDLYKKRYNQGYGSYIFDSQFEFASQTNTVELIFASTPLVGYGSEDKIYSTIFKQSGTPAVEEKIDSVIRILQTMKVTGVTSWDILNGVTVLSSITDYGYAGHFNNPDDPQDDLNFGVLKELFFTLVGGDLTRTQFNLYWSSYLAEITDKDSKLLTGRFYLTPKDIFDLDFSKYVYLDGTLFRLNKITDYNTTIPNDCEVQLLNVINTIY